MKYTLICLCSPLEYPTFGLGVDFCVDIPSQSDVKILNMEQVESCVHPQVDTVSEIWEAAINHGLHHSEPGSV